MIALRRLREADLEYLHRWENEPEVWTYGDFSGPFTRNELREFILLQKIDNEQLRFVICEDGRSVGFLDFFQIESGSAGVGILICDPADRGRGIGRLALTAGIDYARRKLGLNDLWCRIHPANTPSRRLFSASEIRILE